MATRLAARVALAADRTRDLALPAISAPIARKWDVASVEWNHVAALLDQGWEPFAVVQREPNSRTTTTQATVYLKRPHAHEDAPAA